MDEYGIIGNPLAHSLSPRYFNRKFREEGIDACYLPFEAGSIRELEGILASHPRLRGFNVTIPYKQEILPFLDWTSPEAAAIGAVNCVKVVQEDGRTRLMGYNTDASGFRKALEAFMPVQAGKALVLGNGGAARAVRYVCRSLGMEVLTVSRHPQGEGQTGYDSLPGLVGGFRLIVNATPLGTWPDCGSCPDIPYALLTPGHYLFDLVYNPETTEFMKRGAASGAHVCNGSAMLEGQAGKNWEIWS